VLRAPHAEFINPSAKCKHQQLPGSTKNSKNKAKHQQRWQKLAKFKHKLMQQQKQEQKPRDPRPPPFYHPLDTRFSPTLSPFDQATFTVVIVAILALVIVVAGVLNTRYPNVCVGAQRKT